jgi:hypothetical protein
MKPKILLGFAVALMLLHGVMRAMGLAEHTSVIAGMPITSASWILGPLYALAWLAFVVLAPILTLTAVFEIVWSKKRARRGFPTPGKERNRVGFATKSS